MRTFAVIGKNFGDEGKGLATDSLALRGGRTLVARHNGGAQSGHTVESKEGKCGRFVFHELSSGSFRGAGTLWISPFYPDLYKLGEEIATFTELTGTVPDIFAMEDVCVTVPDDILVNMALEVSRGDGRHGSCGMGINECDLRTKAGWGVPLGRIKERSGEVIYRLLRDVRGEYLPRRLGEIGSLLTDDAAEYIGLLENDDVLRNAAEVMAANIRRVRVVTREDLETIFAETDTLIFETGQGLLLDGDNEEYAPHVTASSTGLTNPVRFLKDMGMKLDEAVYVSRTYVTRHGAGRLKNECPREELGNIGHDMTNEPNPWQGSIRYGRHQDEDDFVKAVKDDICRNGAEDAEVALFLTHLNETDGKVIMKNGSKDAEGFIREPVIKDVFDRIYLSATPYGEDVRIYRNIG